MNDVPSIPEAAPRKRRRPKRLRAAPLPDLSIAQILQWADAFYKRHGRWPKRRGDGRVDGTLTERWERLDAALRVGLRGLPGGSSLPRLLAEKRGVRHHLQLPLLDVEQILDWADAHHARTGEWPKMKDGPIDDAPGETWSQVNNALVSGYRGLPGGSSLPRLLADQRGVRNHLRLPLLSIEQILAWADVHKARTGEWPKRLDGPILGAPGENWKTVDSALRSGVRGLPGSSSLSMLLNEHRGVRNPRQLPAYSIDQILSWADLHHARTGKWPHQKDGAILDAPGETWAAVNTALSVGSRGLPGQSSLAMILSEHRGVRNLKGLPRFSIAQILIWADSHYERTGRWPAKESGPIADAPGETWQCVNSALFQAGRSLPGGSSLAQLLAKERGARNIRQLPPLSVEQILKWADDHYHRNGRWPKQKDGPIHDAPGETWTAVESALRVGGRGLPGGSSLAETLSVHRGVRHMKRLPPFSIAQILIWADEHYARTGKWPQSRSGSIAKAPAETWMAVENALVDGGRGLPGGSSLHRLLVAEGRKVSPSPGSRS